MLPPDETSHLEQLSAPVRPDHFLNTLEQLLKAKIHNGKKPGSHHFLTFLDYFLTICTVWLKRSLSAVMLLMWSMSLCLWEKNRSSWALRERQDFTLDLYRSFSLLTTERKKKKSRWKPPQFHCMNIFTDLHANYSWSQGIVHWTLNL